MMAITVKFLGSLRREMGEPSRTLWLPDGATVAELEPHLRAWGLDLDTEQYIVVLDQRGLKQWPSEHRLTAGAEVMVFPHIAGGADGGN